MMKPHYTQLQIKEALENMQGFIDIGHDDVSELLIRLEKIKRNLKKRKRFQKSVRTLKYTALQFKRGLPFRVSSMKRVRSREVFYSWLFSFIGIGLVSFLNELTSTMILMIGSFGASAVLIYGAPRSPLSQPRNIIGGHLVSAFVGVSVYLFIPVPLWVASALAVSTAIAMMHLTKTLHPPGGATALIAIIGGERIHSLGYMYLLSPVLIGVLVMTIIAIFANSSVKGRRYPLYWF